MKKKTANSIICKKMDEWFASIDDEKIRELAKENTIVTGGCIASMLLGEKVNDFDVYFKTKEVAFEIASYYCEKFNYTLKDKGVNITYPIYCLYNGEGSRFNYAQMEWEKNFGDMEDVDFPKIVVKSAGVAKIGVASDYQYFEGIQDINQQGEETSEYIGEVTDVDSIKSNYEKIGKYYPCFVSTNAITLTGKVQLVFRFFGTPEEIHETYDFVHCTNYWTSWDRKITVNEEALEALLSRELIFLNSQYPLAAIIRTRKFIQRGWKINAGQYLKMCFILNDMDLHNTQVLEDQLTGVDVAYFHQLIRIIREKMEKDSDFKLNASYLSTLIDKLF